MHGAARWAGYPSDSSRRRRQRPDTPFAGRRARHCDHRRQQGRAPEPHHLRPSDRGRLASSGRSGRGHRGPLTPGGTSSSPGLQHVAGPASLLPGSSTTLARHLSSRAPARRWSGISPPGLQHAAGPATLLRAPARRWPWPLRVSGRGHRSGPRPPDARRLSGLWRVAGPDPPTFSGRGNCGP